MDRDGTKKLLTVLRTAYPQYYKSMTANEAKEQIGLYEMMFKDTPEEVVAAALKQYIKTNVYPPTIAGLNEIINDMNPDNDTTSALWNAASKAIGRASVLTKEQFMELPEPVQEWFGGISGVRQYALMQVSDMPYVRNFFIKTIGEVKERLTAQRLMPPEIRQLLRPKGELESGN